MENCSRPNYGTVSRIQFKLGAGIETQVKSRDMTLRSKSQRSRSQRHVIYLHKYCNNSVLNGSIKFIFLVWHGDESQLRGSQNGCHGNAGYLATWPRNLHFMAHISKIQWSINFKTGKYIQH